VSSLLDILHRRDSRADEPDVTTPVDDAPATIELHLAVDNGPGAPAAGPVDEPAAGPDIALAPEPVFPAGPEAPPIDPPPADATRVLLARQQARRSRRATGLLAAGLAIIVAGAAVTTWLLNETTTDLAGGDSLFTAPPPATGTVERVVTPPSATPPATTPAASTPAPPVSGPAAAPVVRPAAPPATGPEPLPAGDTAWFDEPAAEVAREPVRFSRGTTTNPLFPKLTEAYAAFQAADFARAETLYQEVRAADPVNVDALLGLAALAVRDGRADEGRALYEAVLAAEPRNTAATSALSTLPASGSRNLDETTLKNLLREQPGAAHLHFALGLKQASAGRWPDAQLAFFDAVRHEPANADYAYNLAVSLDQLGQAGQAAAWYQRAIELATASSLFSTSTAGERLAILRNAGT